MRACPVVRDYSGRSLAYGIDIEHVTVYPQNPVLSDPFLITFEFILLDYVLPAKNILTRNISIIQ